MVVKKWCLYRYSINVYRFGNIDGLFVSTEESLKQIIGQKIYFGDILGKHSDVDITFEEEDFEKLSDDEEKIDWLIDLFGGSMTISGYNPFDYIESEEEEVDEKE